VVVVDPEARLADHLLRRLLGEGVRVVLATRTGAARDQALQRLIEDPAHETPRVAWAPLPAYGTADVLLQLAFATFGRLDGWIAVEDVNLRPIAVAAPSTTPPLAYVHVPAREPGAPRPTRSAERRVAERIVTRLVGAPTTPPRRASTDTAPPRGATVTHTREPAPP
jgi:hypothetical protein